MDYDEQGRIITDNIALPSTMADLLECAINDARKLNRSSYTPHHGQWHLSGYNIPCEICLAGSLIAGTLRVGANYTVTANSFHTRAKRLLIASTTCAADTGTQPSTTSTAKIPTKRCDRT